MVQVKDDLVAALADSNVVVVSGETGSGKTTQVMGADGTGTRRGTWGWCQNTGGQCDR